MSTTTTPRKETLYATARATIASAHFPAGAYVAVRWYHQDEAGQDWYVIDRSEKGVCPEVAYPARHLTGFCL